MITANGYKDYMPNIDYLLEITNKLNELRNFTNDITLHMDKIVFPLKVVEEILDEKVDFTKGNITVWNKLMEELYLSLQLIQVYANRSIKTIEIIEHYASILKKKEMTGNIKSVMS